MTEVLTLDEAAALMRVSRRTVERLIARRQIRPLRIGRSVRVTAKEVDAYLAAAYRQR